LKSIAITGSFASGKSFILEFIKSMGYRVFSCDEYVQSLYLRDDIKQLVVKNIDNLDFFDKKKLIDIIYNDSKQRKRLEKIIHPLVKEGILDFKKVNRSENILFSEVPLLFETGFEQYFDYSICVFCDEEIRAIRASRKKNFSPQIFNQLNKIQLSQQEKRKKSDFSIKSQGSAEQIKTEIKKIIGRIE
jgi:dephospho-CoA kinase